MGSVFDDWIYWHFLTITINYYCSQSILTAEASLHSVSHSTTACKRPSLSPINLRHGPRTENTLRIQYPSNSFIVIAVCLRCRCIALDVCYCCHALKREGILPSCCLAIGTHVTIYTYISSASMMTKF
jgi:hypothetical protein